MPLDLQSRFRITASTSGAESVDRLAGSVGKLERGVDSIPALAKSAGVALGAMAVAGGTALIAATNSAIDFADSIGDAASAAGVGTDLFQALRYEAGLAGVDTEAFAAAMRRANVELGKAPQGRGGIFELLGSDVRTATGDLISADEAIRRVADKLQSIQNPAQRAAAAAAIFGKAAGPQLVESLSQGRDGIDQIIERARALGAVIDEDVIRRAGEMERQLGAVATVVRAQLTKALIALAPQITSAAQAFADAAPKVAAFFAEVTKARTGTLQLRLQETEQAIQAIKDRIQGKDLLGAVLGKPVEGSVALRTLKEDLAARQAEADALASKLRAITTTPTARTTSSTSPGGGSVSDLGRGNGAGAAAAAARVAAAQAKRDLLEDIDDIKERLRRADFARSIAHDADRGYEEIRRLVEETGYTIQESIDGIDTSGLFEDVKTAVADSQQQLIDDATDAADRVGSVFEQGVFALFEDGAKGMVRVFESALAQMAVDAGSAAFKDILQGIFADLGNSGGSSGGGLGGLFGAIGRAFTGGSAQSSPPGVGAATGLDFVVPGPSSGDKVIPLFRANGGERVTVSPRDSTPGGGSAVVIHNNIDARGADPATEARFYRALKESERRTIGQVSDSARRRRL